MRTGMIVTWMRPRATGTDCCEVVDAAAATAAAMEAKHTYHER